MQGTPTAKLTPQHLPVESALGARPAEVELGWVTDVSCACPAGSADVSDLASLAEELGASTVDGETSRPGNEHCEARNAAAILVVDNDLSVRAALRMALEFTGYTVLEAANGLDAETIYRHSPISLVITDLETPERNGIETIIALRRESPGVPVIAMSGRYPTGVSQAALRLGAKAVVEKPLVLDELLAKIRQLVTANSARKESRSPE